MKIKITKNKSLMKEEAINEIAPLAAVGARALTALAPKIIKGVAGLIGGGGDSEKDAQALIDKSQTDPVVIKSQDLTDVEQILRSIEAQVTKLVASATTKAPATAGAEDAPAPGKKASGDVIPDAEGTPGKTGLKGLAARAVGPTSPLTGRSTAQSSSNLASLAKKALGSKALKGKKV